MEKTGNMEINENIVGFNHKVQGDKFAESMAMTSSQERSLKLNLEAEERLLRLREREQALKERQDLHEATLQQRQDQHAANTARQWASNDHLASLNAEVVMHQAALNHNYQTTVAQLMPTMQMGHVGGQALGARIIEPGEVAERGIESAIASGATGEVGATNIANFTAARQVADTNIINTLAQVNGAVQNAQAQIVALEALIQGLSNQVANIQTQATSQRSAEG